MVVVRTFLIALVGVLLWSGQLSAQTPAGTVSGRVVDSTTQQPIPDVAVFIEGTQRGTVTRSDGSFVLGGVPAGPVRVRVRRIGYSSPVKAVVVPSGGTATADFALGGRVAILEEVVTTGYGTQRRAAITGSVATVDATAANVGSINNVSNMIEGRAPGVSVTQNSGEPGAGAQIRIRGGTSISASNEPLYVVDGVPIPAVEPEDAGIGIGGTPPLPRNPMNLINPSDIASITILKDAAASIYGTRAANGVILIETKRGTAGASSMEYEVQASTAAPYQYLNLLNGDEYRQFIQDEVSAGILASTRLADLGTANTDWEHAVTRRAASVNHNLSFAGGSSQTQYRASLNYMSQDGVVLSSGLKRYQARLNGTHHTLGNRLRLGLNVTGSQIKNDYLPYENTGGFEGGVFINMVNFNPTEPITVTDPTTGAVSYFEIGPGSQSVRNPVALAEQIQDFGTSTLFLGNVSADLDIFPSLTARVLAGVDRTDGQRNTYFPRSNPVGASTNGDAREANRTNLAQTLQTVLTFHPQFSGSQDFDILGGYEYNDNTLSTFGAETRGFLTDAFGFNNLASGSVVLPPFSYREDSRLVSFFSRANYSWNDQFFLTGSVRKDGASQFGVGNKWAVFPSISGTWRFTQGGLVPRGPFSNLALRGGYGLLGNPAVPPYASLILLSADAGSRYVFGETPVTGVSPTRNPNPNLKWETTAASNVALDYGFMNNRFNGTFEYYVKNTHDLLLEVSVAQPAVVGTRLENIGKVRNRGVEFSLNAQVLDGPERNWKTGLVLAVERNTVVDLGGRTFIATGGVSGQGQSGQTSQRIIPGLPIGTFYGPQYVGLNDKGQQLFNAYTVVRDSAGREISRTLKGTTLSPGGDDKVVIGNANPNFSLGFSNQANFGKFDLSFLIHSEQGQDVLNETALVYATKSNALQSKNFLKSALDDGVDIHEPQIYSSRWIEDGSFVRLQNVTIGYTFDLPAFTGVARNTRVYLSGDNLLLITGYSGYDPEVHTQDGLVSRGIDYLHYPRPRTFTGGIRVAF